jgi:hypothetical protein
MALSATILQITEGMGPYRAVTIKVTGDASYPTGGYAVPASLFGANSFAPSGPIGGANQGPPPVAGSYGILGDCVGNPYAVINASTGKLQLFVATTGVEVANATSETGYSALLEALVF